MIGPLLAGVLLEVIGVGTLYLLDTLALTLTLWAVATMPAMPPRTQSCSPDRDGTLRQLGAGVRYLAEQPVLVAIVMVDLASMVFALPVALFPELAAHTYGGPTGGGSALGLMFAAYPAGVFLAALLSGTFSRARRHGALMAVAAVAWGGCVVLFGLAWNLWMALTALAAGGAVNFVLSTYRNAISQAYPTDALRGRIQGLLTVVTMGGPQLANALHGWCGALVGTRLTIVVGGALTMGSVGLLIRAVPEGHHSGVDHAGPHGRLLVQ